MPLFYEDGNGEVKEYTPEMYAQNDLDVLDEEQRVLKAIANSSKEARDSAVLSPIAMPSVVAYYQIDASFHEVALKVRLGEVSTTDSINWRLADNTRRNTSGANFLELLGLYEARKQDIWTQFAVWDAGDKTSVFVPVY